MAEGNPSARKKAKLDNKEEFNVSEVKKECKNASVHGVVVKLSPVRSVRKSPASKYFDADFTDGKKTLKFVSYDPLLRPKLEQLKEEKATLTITDCSIKQSTYPATMGNFELYGKSGTKVIPNPEKKFDIPEEFVCSSPPVLNLLRDLKDMRSGQHVTVNGKILSIEDPAVVASNTGSKLEKQDCTLADRSISVRLVIWQKEIGKLVKGSSYRFVNVSVKEFEGIHYLSTTVDSEINKIDDIGEVNTITMPSSHRVIHGEVAGVQRISPYKECTTQSCMAKVNAVSEVRGECSKCRSAVKLSLCKDCVCADLTVQDASRTKHSVTAFTREVFLIIGNAPSDTSDVNWLKEQLLRAEPAVFVVNNKNIVTAVKRKN